MPNRTVYIRAEDLEKWEAVENRPEWLHERLNETVRNYTMAIPTFPDGKTGFIEVKTKGRPVLKAMQEDLCTHFQPKGQCLVKGCKYGKGKK